MDEVLPVTWLSVSGTRIGSDNLVQWSTSNETNNGSFDVEASLNGVGFFKIGNLLGAIDATTARHYKFQHLNVSAPLTYYRIKQTDLNAKVSYSLIVKVAASPTRPEPVLTVRNPISSQANLFFTTPAAMPVHLSLTNAFGHIVETRTISMTAGMNSFSIDMQGRGAGVYFIQLVDGSGTKYITRVFKY
jgi:hypothetical protein